MNNDSRRLLLHPVVDARLSADPSREGKRREMERKAGKEKK